MGPSGRRPSFRCRGAGPCSPCCPPLPSSSAVPPRSAPFGPSQTPSSRPAARCRRRNLRCGDHRHPQHVLTELVPDRAHAVRIVRIDVHLHPVHGPLHVPPDPEDARLALVVLDVEGQELDAVGIRAQRAQETCEGVSDRWMPRRGCPAVPDPAARRAARPRAPGPRGPPERPPRNFRRAQVGRPQGCQGASAPPRAMNVPSVGLSSSRTSSGLTSDILDLPKSAARWRNRTRRAGRDRENPKAPNHGLGIVFRAQAALMWGAPPAPRAPRAPQRPGPSTRRTDISLETVIGNLSALIECPAARFPGARRISPSKTGARVSRTNSLLPETPLHRVN